MEPNIPVEAVDAAAAAFYAAMPKPADWAPEYKNAPQMVRINLRELAVDVIGAAYPVLRKAWDNESSVEIPDDISGLLNEDGDN